MALAFTAKLSFEKVEIIGLLEKEEFTRSELTTDSENLRELNLIARLSMLQPSPDKAKLTSVLSNGKLIGSQLFAHILNSLSHETTNTSGDWIELWADARQLDKEDEAFWEIASENLTKDRISDHYDKLIELSDRYYDLSAEYTEDLQKEIEEIDTQVRNIILIVFIIQLMGFLWGTRGDAFIEWIRER